MTRDDFFEITCETWGKIEDLFNIKNKSYGRGDDIFHNFRETALRLTRCDSPEHMFQVLLVLQDKHRVALANRGLDDPEFEERVMDDIIYSLLAIAMYREGK